MTPRTSKRLACLGIYSLVLLTIAGCAIPRPQPVDTSAFWAGRLALQVQGAQPQNWSASFELHGSAETGQMVLFSPIGTTMARLSWSPHAAWLEQGSNKTESDNLQSLSQRLIGTDLPVAALFAWLAGKTVQTPGWQVDLSEHAQGRLSAKRITPAPEAVLRIMLDR